MPEIKAAGAIIGVPDKKTFRCLLLRSAKNGEWGPPKGKAEPGENEIETASREIWEEAGLRSLSYLPGFRETIRYTIEKNGKPAPKEVVFFLAGANSPSDVKLSPEHTEIHWATPDEIEQLVPHEAVREVFRKALARLKSENLKNTA
jgi:8-oxo-dGTP pyrophosphatase MutT (NUDIX family)